VNLIKTFEMMGRMSEVKRYSMVRQNSDESVLEHTGFVALIACLIAKEMNDKTGAGVQVGRVVTKALFHDIEEIVTGDTPRPTKYHDEKSKAMFERLENEGMAVVLNELGFSKDLEDDIQNERLNAKDGPEGLIVSLSDLLAVVYKSWDEVLLRSNLGMCKVAASTLPDLAFMETKIAGTFNGNAATFLSDIVYAARQLATSASQEIP
jgi:5'-deoxynucleotidase